MKRLSLALGAVVVALLSLLAGAGEARSDVITFDGDSYAAIAYSPDTGKFGFAHNYGSRTSAEKAALNNCKADDARIVAWVHNGFCALALGEDKTCWGVGCSYGDGATNTFARNRALSECNKRTTNARIVLCVCSLNIKPEVNR